MPINVAQLNIVVTADTQAANANLNALNQSFQQVAQNAAQAAAQEAQGQQQVVEAISAVVMAQRASTAAIQQGSAQSAAAMETLATNANRVSTSVTGMGSNAARGLLVMNQSLSASGQAMGPVTNGLSLMASQLTLLPQNVSNVTRNLNIMAGAISAVAAVSTAIGAPQTQALANLQSSLQNAGQDWSAYSDQVQGAVDHGAGYGQTATSIYNALAQLAPSVQTQEQLFMGLQDAEDVAARRGISLATAMDIIVRGVNGASRGLRVLGIDMTLVANLAKNAASAVDALNAAIDNQKQAQDAVDAATTRYNDSQAVSSLGTDQVAKATENLTRAQQDLNDVYAREAAEDIAIKRTHLEEATSKLADAQQKLADTQAKQAAEAAAPQVDKVAEATDRLAVAQQRLQEIQAKRTQDMMISPEDLLKLATASDKVLESQERLAAAQGGDIADAQLSLRNAVDAQRAALDAQAEKQRAAINDISGLMAAQNSVKQSTIDLTNAQREQYLESIGNTPKQIADAISLRDANQAVADAVDNIAIASSQDRSEQALKELQRAKDVRDAENRVADSVRGIADAQNAAAAGSIRSSEGLLGVSAAQDRLKTATDKVAEAQAKADAARNLAATQTTDLLDKVNEKVGGTADKQAGTWAGLLNRIKADFLNFLGDFGSGVGKWLTMLGPVVWTLTQIRGLLGGGAAVEGVAAAGEAAAGEGFIATALGAIGAAAAPVALVILAVAQLVAEIWLVWTYWDTITKAIVNAASWMNDKIRETLSAMWQWIDDRATGLVNIIKNLPERLGDGLNYLAAFGWNLMVGLYNGAVGFWNNTLFPFITGLPGQMTSMFSNIYQSFLNIGSNIINGLWNGIVAAWNGVMRMGGSLVSFFGDMVGNITNFLEQSSPSRLFHRIGANMMIGLHNGITQNAQPASDAVQKVVKGMAGMNFQVSGAGGVGATASAAGLAGRTPGGTVVIDNRVIDLDVHGSVMTERDLVEKIRNTMVSAGRSQGDNYLGGTA